MGVARGGANLGAATNPSSSTARRGALLAALAGLSGAAACGMVTHSVIAHRGMAYFSGSDQYQTLLNVARNNTDALIGGAPFPDYLYECGSNHDDGEWAHWPPFQANAATYIRNFSQPWAPSTAKLFAFMLGVASHQIADVNWHGLADVPAGLGLIETIGGMDYNCTGKLASTMVCGAGGSQSGDVAHTMADTGGEFLATFQTDLGFFEPAAWYIPVQDLINIYAIANRQVNASAIEDCAYLFFVGSWAIQNLGWALTTAETEASPHFSENYVEMPFGGLDDMAVWSARMWDRFALWVAQGPPANLPPDMHASAHSCRNHVSANRRALRRLTRLLGEAILDLETDETSSAASGLFASRQRLRGASSASSASASSTTTTTTTTTMPLGALSIEPVRGASRSLHAATRRVLARDASLRQSLATFFRTSEARLALALGADAAEWERVTLRHTHDAGADAVHGHADAHSSAAPASSRPGPSFADLEVFHGRTASANSVVGPSPATASASWTALNALQYAGKALAVGDFNADGQSDLVITAYGSSGATSTANAGPCPQGGGFYVLFGTNTSASASASASSSSSFSSWDAHNLASSNLPLRPTAHCSAGVFSRLGWDVAVLDFNLDGVDDLAVAAPVAGWDWSQISPRPAYKYTGRVQVHLGRRGVPTLPTNPDVVIAAPNNFTFFGHSLAVGDVNGDGHNDLLVGSPMAYVDAAYPPTSVGYDAATMPSWQERAVERGALHVFTASATAYPTGTTLNANTAAAAILTAPAPTPAGAVMQPYEMFGQSALVTTAESASGTPQRVLVVGAPGWRANATLQAAVTVGRAYIFALPLPAPSAGAPAPLATLDGTSPTAKFGFALAAGRPQGPSSQGATVQTHLFVSAPSSPSAQTAANVTNPLPTTSQGLVAAFRFSAALQSSAANPAAPLARWFGGSDFARFGWALAVSDVTGDGVDDVLVGAPQTSTLDVNGVGGADTGAVWGFWGSTTPGVFPTGDVADARAVASWTASDGPQRGRLGFEVEVDPRSRTILVGAPRGSLAAAPAATTKATTMTTKEEVGEDRAGGWAYGTEMPGVVFAFQV